MAVVDVFVLSCLILGAVSAFFVAFLPNILHAAIALIFCLLSVGGLYGALGADFLAAIQLIIYVGAVIIVIIFAVMMTPDLYQKRFLEVAPKYILPSGVGALLFVGLWYFQRHTSWFGTKIPQRVPITREMGDALIGPYALVFEYVAILLLFGLVGAVVIARTGKREDG